MTNSYHSSNQQVSTWFFLAVMGLTVLTALGFLYLGRQLAPGSNLPSTELKILSRAYDRIDEHYIYDLSEERRAELMHAAISGMVRKLDKYSRYYAPNKSGDYDVGTRGVMAGIGIVVQTVEGQVVLLYPSPGGPAEHAGLKVGDIVTAVNGTPVHSSKEAVDEIRGELDTAVILTIKRGDAKHRAVSIHRGTIVIPSLKWARILDKEKRIGYVYLQKFAENSATELDLWLQQLDAELGHRLDGLVFDLRNNPGGLLNTCLDVTNRFLKKGKIVTLKRRNTKDVIHSADPAKCTRQELALVLLLNGNSASASEVFAGAMTDHGRAQLVGTRSYGKGVVQSVFSWNDSKERVKIPTSYYLTPAGRNIENTLRPKSERGKGGIPPDHLVDFKKPIDGRIAIARLQRREVPRKYREDVDALCKANEKIKMYRPLEPDEDVQLAAALEQVRDMLDARKNGK